MGKEDERHLWPEMLRIIREVKPRYVVGENVFGLVNWSDGLVFEEVQTDLEAEGYEVQAVILPAASVGAPHKRDRVWFVAHAQSQGLERGTGIQNQGPGRLAALGKSKRDNGTWSNFPTQSPVCSRNDGLSSELVGITFSKHRNESIKAYGNAIVPQVVYQIFKALVNEPAGKI
jgi:DNA (cytosine-5)-methyltransferase 1